jgi:GTP-binding protein
MPLPKVAIVGRPNVGKSSVFNWLAGRQIAIVEPTAGVTRDRLSTVVQAGDVAQRWFELIDTGGMGIQDTDNLTDDVEHQITLALEEADVILFLVDARDGVLPLDEHVAQRLRTLGKPVLLVANKCDVPKFDDAAQEFLKLGWKGVLCVSAHQQRNRLDLLDALARMLPPAEEGETAPTTDALKLAIVGRRNTGKSTFINSLAEAERVIVSEVAGTTRDSVDVRIERDGKTIIAIDTAGVRKRKSIANSIEFYSLARAERSIRRADVVLLFFDPKDPVSVVDKQLAGYILENHKPAIFVINKWDLMKPLPTGEYADYMRKIFPSLDYVPLAFVTAKEGKNVARVLNLAQNVFKQASARVSTADINRVVKEALELQSPPLRQNRTPRIYYGTQVAANPPTIVLFTNGPDLFDEPYVKHLERTFRDRLPFREVPIKLQLRLRGESLVPREAEEGRPARKKSRPAPEVSTPKSKMKPKRRERKPDVWRDV